jgi:hypothetical protein
MNSSPKTSSIEQDEEVGYVSQSGEIIMYKKEEPIAKIEQDCYTWRGEIMCPQKETKAVAKQTTTAITVQPEAIFVSPKKEVGGVDPIVVTVLLLALIPFKLLFIGWLVLRVVTKITNKF